MVLAGRPVASLSRLAARPVGEASSARLPAASARRMTLRTVVVLPVPGPPVSTVTRWVRAACTASCCWAVSGELRLRLQGGKGRRPVEALEDAQRGLRRRDASRAQAVGDADLAVVEGRQVDGALFGQDGSDGCRWRERGRPGPGAGEALQSAAWAVRRDARRLVRQTPRLDPHFLGFGQGGDALQRLLRRDAQQLAGLLRQLLGRQVDVALVGGLAEHVGHAGGDALGGIVGDAQLAGDLVGRDEADAVDLACQPVGVGLHDLDGVVAVRLVDLDCQPGRDVVALQEEHHFLDLLLLRPGPGDHLDPLAARRPAPRAAGPALPR